MPQNNNQETIDIAMLPLADGRKVLLPLVVLAEVRQVSVVDENGVGFGTLHWRGLDLPIHSLDDICGLPSQAAEKYTTVGVFRAGKDSGQPFRALAFCGIASHARIEPYEMEALESPGEGHFTAAAEMNGETFLVPDLPGLMYSVQAEIRH